MIFLIRGLPGSGKSTRARLIQTINSYPIDHYEADQYFYRDGVYAFNPAKLQRAHAKCFEKFCDSVEQKRSVCVSNTFTTYVELQPYLEFGHKHGEHIAVVEMQTQYQSIHGVPEATMQKMRARWMDVQVVIEHAVDEFKNIKIGYVRIAQ